MLNRLQILAGIQLNELQINNPNKVFKMIESEDEYGDGLVGVELMDKDNDNHSWISKYSWFGYYEEKNPDIINIEFYSENDKNMNNLINYCKKYNVKCNKKHVYAEIIYIQIPMVNTIKIIK